MKIDINEFRVHKKIIVEKYLESGIDYVSLYSAVAMVPVISLYCYLREEFPLDTELTTRINSLILFYGYTEVIGEIYS